MRKNTNFIGWLLRFLDKGLMKRTSKELVCYSLFFEGYHSTRDTVLGLFITSKQMSTFRVRLHCVSPHSILHQCSPHPNDMRFSQTKRYGM
ncbi:MAG: hypothetical protein ACK5L7_08835 [Paludibacteraceae bacterium]